MDKKQQLIETLRPLMNEVGIDGVLQTLAGMLREHGRNENPRVWKTLDHQADVLDHLADEMPAIRKEFANNIPKTGD